MFYKIDVLFKINMTEYKYVKYPWTVVFLFTPFMNPTGKKRINRALSKQSKQFLLLFIFWFKRLSFKTQFKIEF